MLSVFVFIEILGGADNNWQWGKLLELETNLRKDWRFTITEKAPATASSWLRAQVPYDFCIGNFWNPISCLLTVDSDLPYLVEAFSMIVNFAKVQSSKSLQ